VKSFVADLIETLGLSLIIIFLIYTFIASVEIVYGSSMEPNFYTGERILVDKISKFVRPFYRGEIVVLIPPDNPGVHYIKRIIGLPGDVVKIYQCNIYISRDEKRYQLEEPYLPKDLCTVGGASIRDGWSLRIPDGQYMVLGDNRSVSIDSRSFGLITKDEIVGHVIFRFWPIAQAGFVR
jgi:signal peptidase I